MITLFATTILTCSQAGQIVNRIKNHNQYSELQKIDLINTVSGEVIQSCRNFFEKNNKK